MPRCPFAPNIGEGLAARQTATDSEALNVSCLMSALSCLCPLGSQNLFSGYDYRPFVTYAIDFQMKIVE